MLDVKNSVVGDIDTINPLIGQVTGASKAASINDTQTTALATTNQVEAIREFHGPRADNMPAKIKMLSQIEKFGRVKYRDLNLQLRNSQSLQYAKVLLILPSLSIRSIFLSFILIFYHQIVWLTCA